MMYQKLEGLDPNLHGKLKFKPIDHYRFATTEHQAPIVLSEAGMASRFYPIIFLAGEVLLPRVLLALREGKNAYVNAEGKWQVPYVPAFFRRYPYILGKTDMPGEFAVMIDRSAGHFSETDGAPLFGADGQITQATQKTIDFLNLVQKESNATTALCEKLREKDVLVNRQFEFKKQKTDDAPFRVGGFLVVDRKKLAELDPQVLSEWAGNGLLEFVYAHLNSLTNISNLIKTLADD